MAESTKTYKIELVPSSNAGAGATMYRSGVKFTEREPEILELTQEEAEVFENDWRFEITDTKDSGETLEGRQARESKIAPPDVNPGAEEAVEGETETVETETAPQEEADSVDDTPADSVEDLLKNHSRDELDIQAAELGIENPQELANKTEVAQAIVDAR